MGVVWGLALLSKVTPLLLTPLVVAVIAINCRQSSGTRRQGFARIGVVFGACFVTSGWYCSLQFGRIGKAVRRRQLGSGDGTALVAAPRLSDVCTAVFVRHAPLAADLRRRLEFVGRALFATCFWMASSVGTSRRQSTFPGIFSGCSSGPGWPSCQWRFMLASPAASLPGRIPRGETGDPVRLDGNCHLFGGPGRSLCAAARVQHGQGDLPAGVAALLCSSGRGGRAAPLLQFRVARALVFSAVAVWAFASYAAYFNVSAIARLFKQSAMTNPLCRA